MKKACLVVDKNVKNNIIFNRSLHRDNCNDGYSQLRELFAKKNYDLSTQDINKIDESDIVIYANNMPTKIPSPENQQKSFLILSESSFIIPENFNFERHKRFSKIFTWSDNLVDGLKYIKLNYPIPIKLNHNSNIIHEKKMCAMIAGNKARRPDLPDEILELDLYTERQKAIRWFENNHLDDFNLYGVGWDKYIFPPSRYSRILNRLHPIRSLIQKVPSLRYPSYKGKINNKKEVLQKHKFSICYENAKNIPGYITEKIFDSFLSDCVPIYWGASNIEDHIPSNTFIDKRNYNSYEELYMYLKTMPDEKHQAFITNIRDFLTSDKARLFSSECFAETIVSNVLP